MFDIDEPEERFPIRTGILVRFLSDNDSTQPASDECEHENKNETRWAMGLTRVHGSELFVLTSPFFICPASRQCFMSKKLRALLIMHRHLSPDIHLNASFRDEIPRHDCNGESRIHSLFLRFIS
jgi:hypothetical protein